MPLSVTEIESMRLRPGRFERCPGSRSLLAKLPLDTECELRSKPVVEDRCDFDNGKED
jgi:hypothetical protein